MSDNHDQADPRDGGHRFSVDRVKLRRPSSHPLAIPRRSDLPGADQARRIHLAPPAPSQSPSPVPPPPAPPAAPTPSVAKQSTPAAPATRGIRDRSQTATPGHIARPASPGTADPAATGPQTDGQLGLDQPASRAHLTSAHPLARLRREPKITKRALPKLAAPDLSGLRGLRRPKLSVGDLRHIRFGRPRIRTLFALSGVAAVVAIVWSLMSVLPSVPAAPLSTGSIYQVNWRGASNPPTRFDFGPYFATFGKKLLMLGTTASTTTVWSSSDGSSWSQVSSAGAFGMSGRRFVAQGFADDGGGGLVAIGNSVGSGATTDVAATAWSSRDGVTWVQTQVANGSGQEMIGGAASRPGAVVTAGYGVAWFSADGQHWSPYVLPGATSYLPRAVGSWDGGFVIIGLWNGGGDAKSAVWYSPNGQLWTRAATVLDGFDVRGIASNGGRIVVVGSDTGADAEALSASWSSTDGNSWIKATAPADQANTAMDGVTVVDGSFVAIGAADKSLAGTASLSASALKIWVSEDGTWWLPLGSSGQPISRGRLATVAGRIVAVGGAGSAQRILDGDLVLGAVRGPTSNPTAQVQYAMSLRSGEVPMIIDVTADDSLGPVAAASDRFLAFITTPTGTAIWASANGGLWAEELTPDKLVASGRPVVIQAASDGQGGMIAVGKVTTSSGDSGAIWRLKKGGTWHMATLNDPAAPEYTSIAAGSNGFVVSSDKSGGSTIMFSADGETWDAAAIQVASGYALSVATYQNGYIAAGNNASHQGISGAWTSTDGLTWTARSDWSLPLNVTAMFGMPGGIVAVTNGSGIPAAATATGSAGAEVTAAPSPTTANPTTNWWWSATGLKWKQTGLTISGSNWSKVNGRILALDLPAKSAGQWAAWSSGDGKTWQEHASTGVSFPSSNTCEIAAIGDNLLLVGWQAKGQLHDFYGAFSGN